MKYHEVEDIGSQCMAEVKASDQRFEALSEPNEDIWRGNHF